MSEGEEDKELAHNIVAGGIQTLCDECFEYAQANGFWEGDQDSVGQKIALIHSEVSEMLEAVRKSFDKPSEKLSGYTLLEEEAADTAIRLFDFCGRHKLRLGTAIIDKMKYNADRPYKHGKQF